MAVAWLDARNSDSTQTNEPQEFTKPSCERRPQGRNDELTGLELFLKSIFLNADQKATLLHFQHWGVSTRILAPLFSDAESTWGSVARGDALSQLKCDKHISMIFIRKQGLGLRKFYLGGVAARGTF